MRLTNTKSFKWTMRWDGLDKRLSYDKNFKKFNRINHRRLWSDRNVMLYKFSTIVLFLGVMSNKSDVMASSKIITNGLNVNTVELFKVLGTSCEHPGDCHPLV
jgi:small-conductance mechanosensitive channel